ncbi:hypothetical protein D3C72_2416090 [compost metagenome]
MVGSGRNVEAVPRIELEPRLTFRLRHMDVERSRHDVKAFVALVPLDAGAFSRKQRRLADGQLVGGAIKAGIGALRRLIEAP